MTKGAVLIGIGFTPTQQDVQNAIREGYIKNFDTVSTGSYPQGMQVDNDLAHASYFRLRGDKGWENPGDLEVMELSMKDGRQMWSIYPYSEGPSKKKWWQFWKENQRAPPISQKEEARIEDLVEKIIEDSIRKEPEDVVKIDIPISSEEIQLFNDCLRMCQHGHVAVQLGVSIVQISGEMKLIQGPPELNYLPIHDCRYVPISKDTILSKMGWDKESLISNVFYGMEFLPIRFSLDIKEQARKMQEICEKLLGDWDEAFKSHLRRYSAYNTKSIDRAVQYMFSRLRYGAPVISKLRLGWELSHNTKPFTAEDLIFRNGTEDYVRSEISESLTRLNNMADIKHFHISVREFGVVVEGIYASDRYQFTPFYTWKTIEGYWACGPKHFFGYAI